MSIVLSSGNTSVTGNVTSIPNKVTASFACVSAVRNTTTTIGTVPANKVWRVIACYLSSIALNTAASGIATLKLNNVAIIQFQNWCTATNLTTQRVEYTFDYSACPVLTAGQTAAVTSSNNNQDSDGGIVYVEEDA